MIKEATRVTTDDSCNSSQEGQVTLCLSSSNESFMLSMTLFMFDGALCTGGKIRTHDLRFWRPLLYQLSYTRVPYIR